MRGIYSPEVDAALRVIQGALNCVCVKRLQSKSGAHGRAADRVWKPEEYLLRHRQGLETHDV